MAECHIIGQIIGASDFPAESLFCKYDIHFGENWKLISGLKDGQTQIDSPQLGGKTYWCHPLDVHLATKGVQGWPKICIEIYHQDKFGRNEIYAYGFLNLPTKPGNYKLTCVTWRPTGSLKDEITRFFLGGGLQLKRPELIFTGAERYRLQTETMGKVYFEIGLVLRNFHKCLYFGAGSRNSFLKSSDCENDVCLKEVTDTSEAANDIKVVKTEIPKLWHKTSLKSQNKDENFISNFKKTLDYKRKEIMPENKKPENDIESSYSALKLYLGNGTEQYEEITFTDLITEDVGWSTQPDTEKMLQTTTLITKLNISTTAEPYYKLKPLKAQDKSYCFCDLTVNNCDVNCCCDQDCTSFHFEVFTKCSNVHPEFNSKYCFQNNFIFKNHTLYKMVQNTGGLFCIITENLPGNLNTQVKPFITTLEAFNKNIPEKLFTFYLKFSKKYEFTDKAYKAGSIVWSVQNGDLKPFGTLVPSMGRLCTFQGNIKFLVDEVSVCYFQYKAEAKCGNSRSSNMLYFLKDIKIISNPAAFNKSESDSFKNCTVEACIGIIFYLCQYIDKVPTCMKIESSNFPHIKCLGTVSDIKYQIWHNGSKGITTFEAYVWLKNLSENPHEKLIELRTEVKYLWVGTEKVFHKSGNPGYVTGMAVMAGKKVYNSLNESAEKKEAIELSLNPKDWLSVVGAEKGICSSQMRTPIKFKENGHFMCSLKLTKNYFHKDKCSELQNAIFKLLTGTDIVNVTQESSFNKYVATFGNSRVEDTGDWVQVVIETISSQAVFKSNHLHLICKNIVTDLFVSVIYTNIGSFSQPQSKIIGVLMRFGKHKDLVFNCDISSCDSAHLTHKFKLTTSVQFIDVTKPAFDAFTEPLTLETKLPHDFFYPFFSKSSKSQFLSKFSLVLILSIFVLK